MATKRATPGPKAQGKRKPTAKSSPQKSSNSSATAPKQARRDAEKLVSIPEDVVLAPQVEVPRQPTGRDQSRGRSAGVRELSWA